MKNILIKLLALTTLSLSCYAQVPKFYVTNNLAASNHVLVVGYQLFDAITFYSTNTTPTVVRLYDGAITNVTGAWTNYATYTTNISSTYVTSTGITNYMTNTFVYPYATAHAAATNDTPAIISLVVPAGGSSPGVAYYRPPQAIIFTSKSTLSNNLAGLSLVMEYRTP